MPDKKRKAKREKWLSKKCWLELFDESIREVPENAERIMLLMLSLRKMVGDGKSGRKAARRAIQNCVKACIPFTRTQVLAERAQWKFTKHAKKGPRRLSDSRNLHVLKGGRC